MKVGYSCMPNMKNIIDGSNQHKLKTAHILTTTTKLNNTQCNFPLSIKWSMLIQRPNIPRNCNKT